MTDAIRRAIGTAAAAHGLDPRVVEALVQVESAGDPFAWNPEPRYRYLWHVRTWQPFRALDRIERHAATPPLDFPALVGDRDQEWWGQRASWGLMQIMGAVAREHGFRGGYLTQLVDPATNLGLGCAHLARLLRWAEGDLVRALCAYNGGPSGNQAPPYRSQAYADRVLAALAEVTA